MYSAVCLLSSHVCPSVRPSQAGWRVVLYRNEWADRAVSGMGASFDLCTMCCVCLPGYHHALTVIGIIISAAAHELSDVTHYTGRHATGPTGIYDAWRIEWWACRSRLSHSHWPVKARSHISDRMRHVAPFSPAQRDAPYPHEREREFIFHIATTLEQVHNRNAKLGGLPERHLAHQSWPPIVTIYCKYTLTKLYSQCRRTASGVNEPLVNSACTTARISNISKADRFAVFHRYLSSIGLRYDTIQNTILTCARKLTWVSLIYRTEPTAKKCKTRKLKCKNGYAQK